jgi:lipopolysaccharide/colanic/teichoic acid biosynthesis glycosyltransferase
MHRRTLLGVDLFLLLLATFLAFALRENFAISEKVSAFLPYLAATALMALVLVPLANLHKTIWRFSGVSDYLRVSAAVTGTCAGAVALSFSYNRLDGIARSLPILQGFVGIAILVGARIVHRLRHASRSRRKSLADFRQASGKALEFHVLLVGVTRLAETYVQALADLGSGRVSVAGFLSHSPRHVGRLAGAYAILGLPEDAESILDRLEVRGISVDRIVVTMPFAQLSSAAQKAILHIAQSRGITLQFLADVLDLGAGSQPFGGGPGRVPALPVRSGLEIASPELDVFVRRHYWKFKRGLDVIAALGLAVLLMPIFLLVAIGVMVSLGFPIVFWQHRPGLAGRSFRLYKFRTMGASHGADGRRLTDAERLSNFCNFLRRTRLDELPQLLNILRGEMSFVGPRPLLPHDQPAECLDRLLIRPGLTGWAQVVGGRNISPEDKAALDLWYVCNASLLLDLKIAARTVEIVLFGERVLAPLIAHAWHDLTACGIVKVASDTSIKVLAHSIASRVG